MKDARNLEHIVKGLRERGCDVPIVADIHFKPEAAMEAAKWVEKVRVNPGNYADSKKFVIREYTDEQYAAELNRIARAVFAACRVVQDARNRHAHRHKSRLAFGPHPESLRRYAARHGGERARVRADRARPRLSRFRFLDEGEQSEGDDRCLSTAGRAIERAGPDWNYPLHLGVTEAGEGEDARIKSAIGIGSLLADGIGDTIRVSLTEDSPHEIPVAKALIENINKTSNAQRPTPNVELSFRSVLVSAARDARRSSATE